MSAQSTVLQPIEGLSDTDNFLKVPLRGTFKKLSVFYGSARRCTLKSIHKKVFRDSYY